MVGGVYALGLGYARGYALASPPFNLTPTVGLVAAPCDEDFERGLEDEENILVESQAAGIDYGILGNR